MKNAVQLIAYVDRLGGGNLRDLKVLLEGPFKDLFGTVHLLPFFHPIDGADAGFDPIDHSQVDQRLGDWSDIKALSKSVDVMGDVIVNHMSSHSPQFLDFLEHGKSSRYANLFLTLDTVFPGGATERDLTAIYRPRPGLPYSVVSLASGEKCVLWTTFTAQQIDIDVAHPQGREYLDNILKTFANSGIRLVRLDAVGYAIKKAGTSCFMTPETFEFIDHFAGTARSYGIEVLVEIHSYYRLQVEIAARVDWVYDFALPPLVLHAFAFRTAQRLKEWFVVRPRNALTVLDTHDGIGIIDVGADTANRTHNVGLVPPAELAQLVEFIHQRSKGESRRATGSAASNLDLYQVNCTFYDALGRNDKEYLIARAIQFFMPGVPQVYYVGLLAGENDLSLLARTGVGRDINRHYYSPAEIIQATQRAVVADLFDLIRLRNTHSAFSGQCTLQTSDFASLILKWTNDDAFAQLQVSFQDSSLKIQFSEGAQTTTLSLRSTAKKAV